MGAKLLQDVRQDLADVVQVCEGKKKQTNYLRTLINELVKGTGPPVSPPHCAGGTWPPLCRVSASLLRPRPSESSREPFPGGRAQKGPRGFICQFSEHSLNLYSFQGGGQHI